MNTATIIPILAFIGISATLLYQIFQYVQYKKKHKKPNIPSLKQNEYVVDPKKFIEKIEQHTHEKKVNITKNKQKLKIAYYAIASIFIVFVGTVVLYTRNNNITYIPRAATNRTPAASIPTQNVPTTNEKLKAIDATTALPSKTGKPKVTVTSVPPTTPTKTTTTTTVAPTASFRALLSRTPTPSKAPTSTPNPTVETKKPTRAISTPTKTTITTTLPPETSPTYLAYAPTIEPTKSALTTKKPTAIITQTEENTPSTIPSAGFIENSLILFFAGSAFLLIGFLF